MKIVTFEQLQEEFGCAVNAILGSKADEKEFIITKEDLIAIAKKMAFYLDI